MFSKITKYLGEVKTELKKATWPWDPKEKGFKRYRELADSTIVVFVAMLMLGAFIASADFVLRRVVEFLIR